MDQVLYKLPDGWEWKSLGDLVEFKNGYAFKSNLFSDIGVPVLRISNIQSGGISERNMAYIPPEKLDIKTTDFYVEPGDIVIAMSGATTGKVATNNTEDRLLQNQRVGRFIITDKIFRKYVLYYLGNKVEENLQKSLGAAQPNLSTAQIKEIKIPIQPASEQKRIVEKLDALLTRIDTAIEHLQESVTLADALYASALDKEFSKLMKESGILPFKKLVDNQDGKRIPIKAGERKNTHGTYPYYGATGVIDYVDDFIFEGERLLISEDGANLVARKYPIAFIADGKYWVNNHAHVVNALPELTSNLYLKKFFAWVDLSSYITGSAQPKLSQGKLNTIPVPIPPLSEQTEIVVELDKAYQLTENLKKGVGEKLGMLTSLKASILDSAFKGEL